MTCRGWYWNTYTTRSGTLVLRCGNCGADYDYAYVVWPEHCVPKLAAEARCGSCYVRMFTDDEHAALVKLGIRCLDTEEEAQPVMGLLNLLGYRRFVSRHRNEYVHGTRGF